LIKVETVFFIYIILNRIIAINNLNDYNDLRGLISPYDYETGWTFLVILILLTTNYNFIFTRIRPIYWPIKVGGLLSLMFTTNLNHWHINLSLLLFMIFYFSHKTFANFKIKHDYKFIYVIAAFVFVFVIGYLDSAFRFLKY